MPAQPPPTYSVVIPCYGSRDGIEELLARLVAVFEGRGESFEVICVDDCSPDGVVEVLRAAHARDRRIKVLQHYRNAGQHQALLTGMRHAHGRFVVTMDDDLQHPPEEIPKLIDGLGENDAVVGDPEVKRHAAYRNLGSRVMRWVLHRAFSPPPGHVASAFRLIRGDIARRLATTKTSYPYISGMLLRVTRRVVNVPFRHDPRRHGKSHYSIVKMARLASNLVINHTKLPLQVLIWTGVAVSILSLLAIASIVVRKLFFVDFQAGWTSLVVVISFFGGLNLLGLAVIGEYLVRLLREVSGATVPVVRVALLDDGEDEETGPDDV